jgi:hypothetical protein
MQFITHTPMKKSNSIIKDFNIKIYSSKVKFYTGHRMG